MAGMNKIPTFWKQERIIIFPTGGFGSSHEGRHTSGVYRNDHHMCLWERHQDEVVEKDIKVEICSNCHPFMTGKQKIIDTAGRVERFQKKYERKEKSGNKK